MSEEVAAAIGTIEYWQRLAEQAEADAAALMDALGAIGYIARHPDGLALQSIDAYSRRVLSDARRGAALLAELAAARAVVDAYRAEPKYYDDCDPGQNDPYYAWQARMTELVAAYDAALARAGGEGRQHGE